MKSSKRNLLPRYINIYYRSYLFDNKNKKSPILMTLTSLLGCLTSFSALVGTQAYAEVRVYDPTADNSHISVPRGTAEKPAQNPQNVVNESVSVAVKPGVTSPDPSDSAYVAALQMIKPKEPKLGSVRIFVKADDLNEDMISHLKEIKAIEDLNSEFYFQDVKPTDLVKLFREKVKDYPKDMVFNVDFNGTLATELQVKGKNVIVYTDPKGKISQFELNSVYSFKTAIERIKQGVAN